MTRAEICIALEPHIHLHRDDATGDLLADLLALAFPGDPPAPHLGWGDPIETVRPGVEGLLAAWDLVSRQNGPAVTPWRDGARAVRALLAMIDRDPISGRPMIG